MKLCRLGRATLGFALFALIATDGATVDALWLGLDWRIPVTVLLASLFLLLLVAADALDHMAR